MKKNNTEFSHLVALEDIPQQGYFFDFDLNEKECAMLADRFGLLELTAFSGELRLVRFDDDHFQLTGGVSAKVSQSCTITLEPVESRLEFPIDVKFVTAIDEEDEEAEADIEQLSDPLDIGDIAAQYLGLSLDPYPRKDGAVFSAPGSDDEIPERPNPFSDLKKLQDQG